MPSLVNGNEQLPSSRHLTSNAACSSRRLALIAMEYYGRPAPTYCLCVCTDISMCVYLGAEVGLANSLVSQITKACEGPHPLQAPQAIA